MATVAIFDSGVGGLSVFSEVAAQCPEHKYVFISDNQAFPYGNKSAAELGDRVSKVVSKIVDQCSPDLLVVACNTASTVMLPALRARYDVTIVGVVPAVKPAAALSQTKVIGLLATPATIKRDYTKDLINEFASDCLIVSVGSSELVQMAEDKLRGKVLDKAQLEPILEPFLSTPKLDTLVLACTHFPLLINELRSIFKQKEHAVTIIDSGAAIANRVASLLAVNNIGENSANSNCDGGLSIAASALFTQKIEDQKLIKHLSANGFSEIHTLLVD